jgi:very-short-patch-repair endonuclease
VRRYTRSGIKRSDYERALTRPDRPWARLLIEKYEAQHKTEQKLTRYQFENLRTWTPAESAFASIVREHGFNCRDGSNYFVDFYVRSGRIGFEIDGGIHKRQENYDTARDIAIMGDYKIVMVRFKNEEVLNEPKRVAEYVAQAVNARRAQFREKRLTLLLAQQANLQRKQKLNSRGRSRLAAIERQIEEIKSRAQTANAE